MCYLFGLLKSKVCRIGPKLCGLAVISSAHAGVAGHGIEACLPKAGDNSLGFIVSDQGILTVGSVKLWLHSFVHVIILTVAKAISGVDTRWLVLHGVNLYFSGIDVVWVVQAAKFAVFLLKR